MRIFNLHIFIFTLLLFGKCYSQEIINSNSMKNRIAYVAGKFYPSDKKELTSELKKAFENAKPKSTNNVVAVISPHAGYVFSATIAASAFNQIDTDKCYENIFILASSHQVAFNGSSVYCDGNYETPLGEVKVNVALAQKLLKEHGDIIKNYPQAHMGEHSIEVQLPFLQFKLGNKFQIVPIILGTDDPAECKKLAEVLKPYMNSKNLFVISSDFSHYPSYDDAEKADSQTASSIIQNNPNELVNAIAKNKKENIPGLVTSLCGWTSVLAFLYMTEKNQDFKYHNILYQNSGDSPYGDHFRVVGYNAISISLDKKSTTDNYTFSLTKDEKNLLLAFARKTITDYLKESKSEEYDTTTLSQNLMAKCGAFVSLHKDTALKGCIGSFSQNKPLYQVIQEMALASALHDTRFLPVKKEELDDINIEISVLTPMKKISSANEIELGKHGIYIKKGFNAGTFLPQVADQTGWTKEEFLGHCSRDKAGIGWDGWKTAGVFVYEAIVFKEEHLP